MIRQAGLKRRVGEVVLYIPLLACTAFLTTLLLGLPKVFGLIAAIVAGALPLFVIARMRARRLALFSEQLPDAQVPVGVLAALKFVPGDKQAK